MRKNITHYLVLLFVVGAFATTPLKSFAEEKHEPRDHEVDPGKRYDEIKKRKMERMIRDLNLTEDQQTKIKEIQNKQKDSVVAKKKAMVDAKKALKDAMQGDASDDELRKLYDTSQKAKTDFRKALFEQVLVIRGVLTPEQRKKFKGFDRRHHKKGGKGKHREGPRPE